MNFCFRRGSLVELLFVDTKEPTNVNTLTSKQKRYLRTVAHTRKPIVIIGGKGLSAAVLNELELALEHHELVKVRIQAEDRNARQAIIGHICNVLGTELVQRIGYVATFYKRNPARAARFRLP